MPHKKTPPPSEDAQTNTRSRFARLVQRDEHIVQFVDATVVVVVCRVSCRGSIVSSSSMISTAGAKSPFVEETHRTTDSRVFCICFAAISIGNTSDAVKDDDSVNGDAVLRFLSKSQNVQNIHENKGYSSWKSRFQVTTYLVSFDANKKGKRHMGFSKTPKQRRRLRGTKLVDKTLERPMKNLGLICCND